MVDKMNGMDKGHLCVGIDGSIGEWMAVAITDAGIEVKLFMDIAEICTHYSQAERMLIDIPIGLPENAEEADLRPDTLLRKTLKGKASSVFNTPCRQAVYELDNDKARELNIQHLGKSLSSQSLAFRGAIRQVDCFLLNNPAWKNRLLESHPEYCFMLLNSGLPVMEKKREPIGQQKRLEILEKYYPNAAKVIDGIPNNRQDDVVDALCMAVIARLTLSQGICSVPEKPQTDNRGLMMQIVGV